MGVIGYVRTSTSRQDIETQKHDISQVVPVDYWFEDIGVSGGTVAKTRSEFNRMMSFIRDGETLAIHQIDRLGRDAIDVVKTVEDLKARNINLVVSGLPDVDFNSQSGSLVLRGLALAAEIERNLIIERTQAGLARAKAEGKKLGRKPKTSPEDRKEIIHLLNTGSSVSSVARIYDVSRATIISIRDGEKIDEDYIAFDEKRSIT